MQLKRVLQSEHGIFSNLTDDTGLGVAYAAEHAYDGKPKIPNGTYKCVRGTHYLPWHSDEMDPVLAAVGAEIVTVDGVRKVKFTTFEITGVEGHSKLLFHWGNDPQKDSDGCVLLGESIQGGAVTHSRATFAAFMSGLEGVQSFVLVVSG